MPDRPIIASAGLEEMPIVARLFRDYEAWLGVSLCFQDFDKEVASLPGFYAAPKGGLWLGWRGDAAVGVVGLRPLADPGTCEMKRLWVDPAEQGSGLGRRLACLCIDEARARGYTRLCLDTLPKLDKARTLYRSLGFCACERYNDNNLPGVLFYELDLTQGVTERA